MAELRMPKMGDGMEAGTINVWLKKEGDHVIAGEPIAEVETDKANVEIESFETGTLSKIIVQVGETVPVGEVIAMIGSAVASNGASAKRASGAEASANGSAGKRGASKPTADKPVPSKASPIEIPSKPTPHLLPSTERMKISPLARKITEQLGIDPARLTGTGPAGRIVARDIESYQKQSPSDLTSPDLGSKTEKSLAAVQTGSQVNHEIKPSKMREAIARRVVQSKQNIPHFYVTMVIEMDRALVMLKELNADSSGSKVTVNDIIVKACADALGKVPIVNSTWTAEGTIRRYEAAHIGIAVGIEEGLIIPVVRDCQSKTLRQISAEAKSLITKARNNELKPDEYSGGTFSISNLGMMGVDEFLAIINPPEAAILAIGGAVRQPVVKDGSDEIVIRTLMKVALSADHRLLDGVSAAQFLQEVKKALESPFSLVS